MNTQRLVITLSAIVLLFAFGACKKEEVQHYKAVKDPAPEHKHSPGDGHDHDHAEPTAPSQAAAAKPQGKQRLLGAIAVHADKTWFFKLIGPSDAIAAQAEKFHTFVHSLQFTEDLAKPVAWTLPEGWITAAEGPGSIRYATLRTGSAEGSPELTVIPFPGAAGGIEENINRWRGQIGLPPFTDQAEVRAALKTETVGGKQVIEVDMAGDGTAGAAAKAPFAPFAQGPVGAPAAKGQDLAPVIEKSPADSPLTYTVPAGWKEHEPRGMRKADFSVGEGEKIAQTTFIPLGGPAGGVASNVNRWRGQIGLEPLDPQELDKQAVEITLGGEKGQSFDLQGAESRILGVIVKHGDTSWFIKMTGPVELVGAEKANFEALVKSVKFKD